MRALLVFLLPMFVATSLSAQRLTDQQIGEAIKAGESRKFNHLISDCVATAGFGAGLFATGVQPTGGFSVVLSGNAGRVAYMAARAKRLYKPFSIDNVNEDLRTPAVVVTVEPNDPYHGSNSISVASPIEHVVLKSKTDPDVAIQPTKIETEPVEWTNLVGGTVKANRAVAFFPHDAVAELPPGEFDIVVITAAGERRCKVGNNDRNRLFPKSK